MFPLDIRFYFDNDPRLLRRVERAILEYSSEICETSILPESERFAVLETRICLCWRHHLLAVQLPNGAPLDVDAVFQSILDGVKYQTDTPLGGNPVRDIVLVQAMAWGENKAWQIFEDNYKTELLATARKRQYRDDYWNDFLSYLGKYDVQAENTEKRKSRIDGYIGISGLKKWVSKTHFHFLSTQIESSRRDLLALSENTIEIKIKSALSNLEQAEFQDHLKQSLRQSLAVLPNKYRYLMILLFQFGVTSREAAQIYGVHEGTVSRWKTEAITMIRESLFDSFEKKFGWENQVDSEDVLSNSSKASANIVFEELHYLLRQLQQETEE